MRLERVQLRLGPGAVGGGLLTCGRSVVRHSDDDTVVAAVVDLLKGAEDERLAAVVTVPFLGGGGRHLYHRDAVYPVKPADVLPGDTGERRLGVCPVGLVFVISHAEKRRRHVVACPRNGHSVDLAHGIRRVGFDDIHDAAKLVGEAVVGHVPGNGEHIHSADLIDSVVDRLELCRGVVRARAVMEVRRHGETRPDVLVPRQRLPRRVLGSPVAVFVDVGGADGYGQSHDDHENGNQYRQ